ncbi:MAG: hypothetical protein ACHQX4_09320 [Gemmatimonadales bacterium]
MPARQAKNDWFLYHRLEDRSTYLRWTNLFEFLVSADGRLIEYRPLARATHESFTTYLLGQVLSFSLLALGEEPLHATAIVARGRAIAFLGDGGSGKSTLGAAFLRLGYELLTDDLLALEPRGTGMSAHPGIPRIKLFPRVARAVLGQDGGPTLNNGTSKQILPLASQRTCGRQVPLAALYVLSNPRAASRRIRIEPLRRGEALRAVIGHSFNTIVVDRDRLANQFVLGNRLIERVPVKRLTYPRSLAALPAVCDAVLRDAVG